MYVLSQGSWPSFSDLRVKFLLRVPCKQNALLYGFLVGLGRNPRKLEVFPQETNQKILGLPSGIPTNLFTPWGDT